MYVSNLQAYIKCLIFLLFYIFLVEGPNLSCVLCFSNLLLHYCGQGWLASFFDMVLIERFNFGEFLLCLRVSKSKRLCRSILEFEFVIYEQQLDYYTLGFPCRSRYLCVPVYSVKWPESSYIQQQKSDKCIDRKRSLWEHDFQKRNLKDIFVG